MRERREERGRRRKRIGKITSKKKVVEVEVKRMSQNKKANQQLGSLSTTRPK